MILFPAIDLQDGQCVRLIRGDAEQSTVYNDNPSAQARIFADAGCKWMHVVDLDGAFEGFARNSDSVTRILNAVNVPIELGGGIRDTAAIDFWLDHGVARVIIGTAAVENPSLVKSAALRHEGKIAVAIDARNGLVSTRGWVTDTDRDAIDLAKQFEDCGVAVVIYTDIERDGVLKGPNIEATAELADNLTIPVIASGGISSLEDLRSLAAKCPGLEGVIVGRALYDGRIQIEDALAVLN